jgi:predicted 2-oxoglutarate/Fe(II)-dependent dioxygenase YbiX
MIDSLMIRADELRQYLLQREKELSAKTRDTDKESENALKLKEVYHYLEEIESDKAEAT